MPRAKKVKAEPDRPLCETCGESTYFFNGVRKCENQSRYRKGKRLPDLCDGPLPVPRATSYTMSESGGRVTIELHAVSPKAGSVPIAYIDLDAEGAKGFLNAAGFVGEVLARTAVHHTGQKEERR